MGIGAHRRGGRRCWRGRRAGLRQCVPAGDRCRIPELRDRSAREEPDDTTCLHRVWHRWLCHLPALAAASVYEYGESISLGTAVFDDYVRIAEGATTTPTALQLLTASDTTAVLYRGRAHRRARRRRGWRLVADDHGMLLLLRGDTSWATSVACPPPSKADEHHRARTARSGVRSRRCD